MASFLSHHGMTGQSIRFWGGGGFSWVEMRPPSHEAYMPVEDTLVAYTESAFLGSGSFSPFFAFQIQLYPLDETGFPLCKHLFPRLNAVVRSCFWGVPLSSFKLKFVVVGSIEILVLSVAAPLPYVSFSPSGLSFRRFRQADCRTPRSIMSECFQSRAQRSMTYYMMNLPVFFKLIIFFLLWSVWVLKALSLLGKRSAFKCI